MAGATAMILISSSGFGSLSTLMVLIMQAGVGLVPAMFWRYLLASLFLLFFLRQRVVTSITQRQAVALILVGGLGQAVITYLSLAALAYLPVGPLAFLFYTYPAWVVLISSVTGRERLTLQRLIALVIAMMGIVVMVGAPNSAVLNKFGVLLALGTAFLFALYLPALTSVQRGVPAGVSTFYLVAGVFGAFAFASMVNGEVFIPATVVQWRYLLTLALLCTVIAFGTLIAGLRVLGPVRTSIIATIEPFFTALLGVIFLGEAVNRNTFFGGALIAAAVLILQRVRPAPANEAPG